MPKDTLHGPEKVFPFKGTHARDLLNGIFTIFCIIQSLKDARRKIREIGEILFKVAQIFKDFDHSAFSPNVRILAFRYSKKAQFNSALSS
jgi:hypothetical protein